MGLVKGLDAPSINLVTPTWTLFTWEEWKCSKVASKAGVQIAFTTVVYYLTGQVCFSVTKHIWTNIFLHTKWERRQLLEDLNQAREAHNKWRVAILCFILVAPSNGFLRKGLSFIPSYWSWAAVSPEHICDGVCIQHRSPWQPNASILLSPISINICTNCAVIPSSLDPCY